MKKIYIIAGEPSGDLLASRLMYAMKGDDVRFSGVGGETMKVAGLKSLFDISEISVMGFFEVLPRIPLILKRIRQTLNDIEKVNPDIVITVDSFSFSKAIHQGLKKRGFKKPHIHYVAPQVWAWKKKRAKTIHQYIDYLMCLLPFEEKLFTPFGMKTSYVGHSVIESGADKGDGDKFLKENKIPKNATVITMLPGSRHSEVRYLLPILKEVADRLNKKYKNLYIVMPTVDTVAREVQQAIKKWDVQTIVVQGQINRYNAFNASKFAISASGTVSLELAMARLPHMIIYKMNALTGYLARKLLKIKYVNLINTLADKKIIPELLQQDCNVENIMRHISSLQGKRGQKQVDEAGQILNSLGVKPSEKVRQIIWELIK